MCLIWAMSYIEMPGIHLLRVPEAGSCRDAVDWFEIDQGHDESQWSSWKLSLAVMSVSESSENLSQSFWFYLFLSFFLGSALRSPLLLCLALVSFNSRDPALPSCFLRSTFHWIFSFPLPFSTEPYPTPSRGHKEHKYYRPEDKEHRTTGVCETGNSNVEILIQLQKALRSTQRPAEESWPLTG